MKILLRFVALVAFVLPQAQAAEQVYGPASPIAPQLAERGSLPVGVKTLELVNSEQLDTNNFNSRVDRPLTLEVWYPAHKDSGGELAHYDNETRTGQAFSIQGDAYRDARPARSGDFPLVVISHGYTGFRTIMFYLGEHLASHGYVVAAIDHTNSTNADVDFENNPGGGFVDTLMNRSRDQQFVLETFADEDFVLSAITNTDKAGLIGYSMGGYGALNTVGGCYEFTPAILGRIGFPEAMAEKLAPVFNFCNAGREAVDPRWGAMVSLSPWGQEQGIHREASLAAIEVPSLLMVGEQDDIVGFDPGVKSIYEAMTQKDRFMLVYENARHNIAPHPAPEVAYQNEFDLGHHIEPVWSLEQLNSINEHFVLAFMDCYLKSESAACDFLPTTERALQTKQADGSFNPAWPGFEDRWGAAMRFYRGDR